MDKLNFSRRNKWEYETASPEAIEFVNSLVDEFNGNRRRQFSDEQKKDCLYNFKVLVLDLLAAWSEDRGKYIGYSRGKKNYTKGGAYWDPISSKPFISSAYYIQGVDFLTEKGLVENHIVNAGGDGFSSRVRATERLAAWFTENKLSWASLQWDSSSPVIIVKDKNKKPIPLPKADNFDLEAAIKNLKRINQKLEQTYLNFNISDEIHDEIKLAFSQHFGEEVGFRDPLDFSNRYLKRVFSLGDFAKGGRFYGGWWQGVPSKYRKHIEIEGCVTAEYDYSEMQPRILYALANKEIPDQPYQLDGWEEGLRPVIKNTFYKLINGAESSKNPNQWNRFTPDIELETEPQNWSSLTKPQKNDLKRKEFFRKTGRDFNELISSILEKHQGIANSFFSKAWGEMQSFDSQIAERVMIQLLDEEVPITVLPIHDSFIVKKGSEKHLERVMSEAFDSIMGQEPIIRRDPTVYDNGNRGVIRARDIYGAVNDHMKTHSRYHKREAEWIIASGLCGID